jgi:transcriptional regulator with XRE-family HTH domain
MTNERPGDRIKALRTERKLTQEQLAKAAGISIGFLSDVETGNSKIGADKLLDLAEALDVTLDYLMKGEVTAASASKSVPLELPAALVRTAEKWQLTVNQARRLMSMQQQIVGFRNDNKSTDLESFDWDTLYRSVKNLIQ